MVRIHIVSVQGRIDIVDEILVASLRLMLGMDLTSSCLEFLASDMLDLSILNQKVVLTVC